MSPVLKLDYKTHKGKNHTKNKQVPSFSVCVPNSDTILSLNENMKKVKKKSQNAAFGDESKILMQFIDWRSALAPASSDPFISI